MSDVPRLSEAFEGYVVLANQLLASWTPFATSASARVGADAYAPDDIAADFPTVAKLLTESWMAIGSEALDAFAILTSDFSEERKVGGYGTDPGNAMSTRTLTVKADLVSITGQVLPKDRIAVVPAQLAAKHTQFVLQVNGDGLKARTYDGHVLATDEAGGVEEIPVSVTIG